MATKRTSMGIAQVLLTLRAHAAEGQTDGQLLRQFLGQRDEGAFAALVRRHGPMVLGVCRRVLGNAADAEDAFQATFLVLVRKAAALKGRSVLGDWLHGVARRTALKAKGAAAHRWAKEQAMARPEAQGEGARDDWLPLLDEELSSLPEKYRLPIVLCDLQGKTRKEAAGQLGWPEGTVAGRLARGRTMLSKRLVRRGVILPGGVLSAALPGSAASACVPPTLLFSTIKAASLVAAGQTAAEGVISAKAAALMGEVMKAMLLSKLKFGAVVLLACVLGGLGWVAYGSFAQDPAGGTQRVDKKAGTDPERKKSHGKAADVTEPDTKGQADKVNKVESEVVTSRELMNSLQMVIDMNDFQSPMTLNDVLEKLYQTFATKGKQLPILIDVNAFREENPDAPSPSETPVIFPRYPKSMSAATLLKLAISQTPTCNARMMLRNGAVWITAKNSASLENLLQEKILAHIENRPLVNVVQELSDMTGVSITLDPRVEEKATTRISVTFRNDVTLGGALRIVADMAGLKVVQSGLYITTPANAKELQKELPEPKKNEAPQAAINSLIQGR